MPSTLIHVASDDRISTRPLFFKGWKMFHFTYILSIHSFKEHLVCLHVLTIVINAAMNMGLQISPWDFFFIYIYTQKFGLLNHMVALFLIFEEAPHCSPGWFHWFKSPPTVHRGSLFSTSSPTLISCHFETSQTWVWANSGRQWRTGWVGHDWATEWWQKF